jgi:hypothetical protein
MKRAVSVVAALALAVGSGWVAAKAYRGMSRDPVPDRRLAAAASPVSSANPEAEVVTPANPLPVFAVAGGVRLRLLSSRPVLLAYHEASMPRRLALRPLGSCLFCRNRSKFRPHRVGPAATEYMVMDTRGRPGPATSAVDVVLRRAARVLSPVTGRVWRVRGYKLYGRYPDVRVAIRPRGRPDRLVVLIHLRDVRLRPGQRVVASVTVLGRARPFRFESQVDRYARRLTGRAARFPHTHLEVKRPPREKVLKGRG